MLKIVTVLLAGIMVHFAVISDSLAAIYYVRGDGGTATQCNGQTDAPYPGSGEGQPCAWAHPFWALNAGSPPTWKLSGGDTLVIHSGSYRMGIGAPNTSWCVAEYSYDCMLPPLPSGPNAEHPTKLLGYGWNDGCLQPPELWGAERPWHLLDLNGTNNAVVACLELTDHSGCIEFHANPAVECKRDGDPYGDWASVGLEASDSSNVLLQDLDIHGLASLGAHVGRIADWTIERVRIAGNGWCGWDGDIGDHSSNSGILTFKHWTVEWNGCAETYPEGQPNHCWDQTHGGYGDGVGTGSTGGHWIIEDSIFRYNTSDGLDLLYVRENPSMIEIRRSKAYGNAGNPIKIAGPTKIENSLMIGDCGYFSGKPFAQEMSDHCRAGGNSLALSLGHGDQVTVVNSTVVGQGDCLVEAECNRGDLPCDGSESVTFLNNIFRGYTEFLDPRDTACLIWDPDAMSSGRMDYNLIYNAKNSNCPRGGNDLCSNPLFISDDLNSFDPHLQASSPAVDSGLAVGDPIPDHDIENRRRPQGTQVDRGAFEHIRIQHPRGITSFYPLLLE